jgi:ribosomal protein S18 acetylase RimI-like enzyme
MTSDEFTAYEDADAHRYAESMVRAGYWPAEGALARAKATHARLLPQGLETRDQLFFVIEAGESPGPIGAIWLSIDRESSPPTGFVFDLFLDESYRRQGLGRRAMLSLEEKARAMGLASLSLHVFEDNAPARALYAGLGFEVRSLNLVKHLSDPA